MPGCKMGQGSVLRNAMALMTGFQKMRTKRSIARVEQVGSARYIVVIVAAQRLRDFP